MASIDRGSRAQVVWVAGAAWMGTIGRPVFARALPTWLGVAIAAGILMGGNGLSPRDLGALVASSARAWLVLGGAWLLLIAASVRAAFGAPGAAYLRALPGGRGLERASVVAVAAAAHAPWAVLWLRAAGPARGGLAWLAMTVASLVVVGAVVRLGGRARAPRWRSALGALAGVHARSLVRRRGSALLAGAGMAGLGGCFAGLLVADGAGSAGEAAVIAALASSVALGAALVAATASVADSDRQLDWIVAPAGLAPGRRRAALALVLGGLGLAASVVATAAALAAGGPRFAGAVAGAHAALGLALGLGAVGVAGRARRGDPARIDGAWVAMGLVGLAVVDLAAAGLFGVAGLLGALALGAGVAAGGGKP